MPALKEKLPTIIHTTTYYKTGNSINGKGVYRGFLLIELLIALCSIALFSIAIAFMQGLSSSLKKDTLDTLKAVSYAEKTMEQLYENPAYAVSKQDAFSIEINRTHPFPDIPYTMASVTVSWKNSSNTMKKVNLHGGWYD